jgi:hypothetical protein
MASENASTFENNDVGRNVPLDVLLKAMLASEAQVVFEYFRRGALSQIVYHSVPLSSHIRCKANGREQAWANERVSRNISISLGSFECWHYLLGKPAELFLKFLGW